MLEKKKMKKKEKEKGLSTHCNATPHLSLFS